MAQSSPIQEKVELFETELAARYKDESDRQRLEYLKDILKDSSADDPSRAGALLLFLEHYVRFGGTIRKWAEQNFFDLCQILSTSAVKPYFRPRIMKLAMTLSEILGRDLTASLPFEATIRIDLQVDSSALPSPTVATSFINLLLVRLAGLSSTKDDLTETAQGLRKAGFHAGQIKHGKRMVTWNQEDIGTLKNAFFSRLEDHIPKLEGVRVFADGELKELGIPAVPPLSAIAAYAGTQGKLGLTMILLTGFTPASLLPIQANLQQLAGTLITRAS